MHRTGRTGRAGRTGSAVSIVAPQDIGHLYLLRLTYKIRPIEKQLPTAGELKTREETDLVQILADAFLVTPPHPDDVALAKRLLSHDAADQIIAGLVRDHLGARPEAIEPAAAARRSKVVLINPEAPPLRLHAGARLRTSNRTSPHPQRTAPSETLSRRRLPRIRRDRPARGESAAGRSAGWRRRARGSTGTAVEDDLEVKWTIEPHPDEASRAPVLHDPTPHDRIFAEIFVNLGRRDGVSASDFQRVLTDVAEISRAETGKIRIRDHSSFVSVKRELLDKAVAALNGATFSGKVAQAQPARARSTGTSSPNDG